MKIKYLSFAFAVVALASCSNDQLGEEGVQQTIGENEVFAFIADDDADVTRAGFATFYNNETGKIKQQAVFQAGDQFKMYRTDTWKPQVLKFKNEALINGINGGVFEWANFNNAQAKYNVGVTEDASTNYGANDMTGREYAVYPADQFQFTDEMRGTLQFTLAPTNNLNNLNNTYVGVDSDVKEGYTIYNSLVPMFGFYMGEAKGIKFNYMTSLVRVYLQGLAPGAHKLTLFTADDAKSNKLNGVFTATQFDAADYTAGDDALPVFNSEKLTTGLAASIAAADGSKPNELNFTFNTTELESDFVIFLPIPTGEYTLASLKLYLDYDGVGDDEIPLTLTTTWASGANQGKYINLADCDGAANTANAAVQTLGRGIKLLAEKKTAIKANASSLWEINNLLALYAAYGRDIEAEITLDADINVVAENASGYTSAMKQLIVPTLQNNVKLTLKKGTGDEITGRVLNIVDEGTVTNKKNFTLKLDAVSAVEGINYTSKQNFELEADEALGTADTKPVTINTDADVTLKATDVKNLVITAANKLTIAADPKVAFTTAAPTTVNSAITASITASNNIEIDAEGKTIATLNFTGASKTVNIKKGTVTNLVIGTPAIADPATDPAGITASVTMTDGTITNLKGTGTGGDAGKFLDGTHITVTTSGAAAINAVSALKTTNDATKASISFTSTYSAVDATAAAAVDGVIPIYTAGQLKAVVADKAYKLMTDVTIPADKAWESVPLTKSFDGNNKTITGLKAPLFGDLTTGGADITVKNLTLASVDITGKNIANKGALAQSITGTWIIEGVKAAGTVGSAAGDGNLTAKTVGGLVGTVGNGADATNVTIKKSSFAGTVQGYCELGGFIGKVNKATVAISEKPAATVALTLTESVNINATEVPDYGKAGAFIGTIAGTDNAITIGKDDTEAITSYFTAAPATTGLYLSKCVVADKAFNGMPNHEIGYSPAATGSLSLYGNAYMKTADRSLQAAAGDGIEALTITNYVNYFAE